MKLIKFFDNESKKIIGNCYGTYYIEYTKNDVLHRINGPALMLSNNCKAWYIEGLLHREDGPAVIYLNKLDKDRYFLFGKEFKTKEQWQEEKTKLLLQNIII